MIQGKNDIQQYFYELQKPFFAIFKRGEVEKGNAIIRNDKDGKEQDFDSAKSLFDRAINWLQHGDYILVVNDKNNVTERGSNRVEFRIPVSESNPVQQQNTVAGIGAISMDQVENKANEIAEKKFAELMLKQQVNELKEKNAALEKDLKETQKSVHDPLNRFIGAIAPYSEKIIAGFMGAPAAKQVAPVVSGIAADAVQENHADPEAQKVVEDFITALVNAKPNDWKQILQQLTNLINTDVPKFETALKFL